VGKDRGHAAGDWREEHGAKKKIADFAKRKGLAYAKDCQVGGQGRRPYGYGIANKLVHKKIHALLGLDKAKYLATGAAPIQRQTLEYF